MKISAIIAASTIVLSSANLFALDINSCNRYMDNYHKYLSKYEQDTKNNATTHAKKTDADMAKYYQDELLDGCEDVIDLREIKNNKYKIDTAYKIYH